MKITRKCNSRRKQNIIIRALEISKSESVQPMTMTSSMSPFPKKKNMYIYHLSRKLMTISSPITPFKYTSTPLYDGSPGITRMIKAGVINKYSQVCKKKEKKTKTKKQQQKTVLLLFPPPQGFPKLFIKELIPVLYKREDGGKQERRNETTFMDLIRSNKKRPAPRAVLQFSMFQDLIRLLKF